MSGARVLLINNEPARPNDATVLFTRLGVAPKTRLFYFPSTHLEGFLSRNYKNNLCFVRWWWRWRVLDMGGGWFETFLHRHILVWTVLLRFQNNQLFCPFVPRSLISTWHCTWIFFFGLHTPTYSFFDCQYHQIRSYLPFPPKALTFFIHSSEPAAWTDYNNAVLLFSYQFPRVFFFELGVGSILCILFICCMLRFFWTRCMYFFFKISRWHSLFLLGLVVCVHPLVVILLASCSAICFTVMGNPLIKKLLSSRCDSSLGHWAENLVYFHHCSCL